LPSTRRRCRLSSPLTSEFVASGANSYPLENCAASFDPFSEAILRLWNRNLLNECLKVAHEK
jgi:hypothetical protein